MNDKLLKQAETAYVLALNTHIKLLSTCFVRHKATEGTYEELFAVFHELAEKNQQVVPSSEDPSALVSALYSSVEALKMAVNSAIKSEKDEGVKNQLIQKYDDLQMTCAKLKSVIDEEEGEEYGEKEVKGILTRK